MNVRALNRAHMVMWALLFLTFLPSCSSIGTHIPAMQMESPETHGKLLKARLSFAAASTSDIIVIDDASSRPLRYNNPVKSMRDSEYYVSGSMGVLDRLDVGIKAGVVRSIKGPIREKCN